MKSNFVKQVVTIAGIALVAVLLLFGQAIADRSSSLKQEQDRNKQLHSKKYQRVKELNEAKETLADIRAGVEDRLEAKEEEIARTDDQLAYARQRCESLQAEELKLEADLDTRRERLGERARMIYMQGDMTYLELLFQSDGFTDMIDRMFFVQAVLDHDKQLVADAECSQQLLQEKQTAISSLIDDIGAIREQLDGQLADLESIREELALDIQAIESDKALYIRQADELEAENKRIQRELRDLANTASGYIGTWGGGFKKPCPGSITSGFGMRIHPIYKTNRMHTGVDIGAPKGTPIKAADDGKVIYKGRRGGYGKTVIIDHGSGHTTLYGHMSKITCNAGDHVTTSTKIGEVGSTGTSTGNHLHFEHRINGDPVDPMKAL